MAGRGGNKTVLMLSRMAMARRGPHGMWKKGISFGLP